MLTTLSFSASTPPIVLPAIIGGPGNGIQVQLWIKRSGGAVRQRIIELSPDGGPHLVLGTGDQADSLTLGIEQGTSRAELVALGALPVGHWVQITAVLRNTGAANLSVFSVPAVSGFIGTLGSAPLSQVSVAGGSAGHSFVGQLSQLVISQLAAVPSNTGTASPVVSSVPTDSGISRPLSSGPLSQVSLPGGTTEQAFFGPLPPIGIPQFPPPGSAHAEPTLWASYPLDAAVPDPRFQVAPT